MCSNDMIVYWYIICNFCFFLYSFLFILSFLTLWNIFRMLWLILCWFGSIHFKRWQYGSLCVNGSCSIYNFTFTKHNCNGSLYYWASYTQFFTLNVSVYCFLLQYETRSEKKIKWKIEETKMCISAYSVTPKEAKYYIFYC